jgi:hypothetical protein
MNRYLAAVKLFLFHVRLTLGYLAVGFLVSAPIQLGFRGPVVSAIFASILYGIACAVLFAVLIPFTRISWEEMRVPEFKLLEMAHCRNAAIFSLAFLVVCLVGPFAWLHWRIAWIVFVIMVLGWAKVKFQTFIFKEFYTLKPEDRLLALPPKTPGRKEPESTKAAALPAEGPGSDIPSAPPESDERTGLAPAPESDERTELAPAPAADERTGPAPAPESVSAPEAPSEPEPPPGPEAPFEPESPPAPESPTAKNEKSSGPENLKPPSAGPRDTA